tara:strand:+ start:2196 stop:2402 length:207 start_codon:yes stop_codon:yes gene_type:complete
MDEFNGWGSSTVATKYIYLRIQAILDHESSEDMDHLLSRLCDELARAFFSDTKKKIGKTDQWLGESKT